MTHEQYSCAVVSTPPFAGFVRRESNLRVAEWVRPLADGTELRYIYGNGLFWVRGDGWWPVAFVRSEQELERFIEILEGHNEE